MTVRSLEPVLAFLVSEGHEEAQITVLPFRSPVQRRGREDRVYNGVTVQVLSTYGVWGHCWTHIGDDDWRAFLVTAGFDYVMGKFMQRAFRVPKPHDENCKSVRAHVIEERKGGCLSKADARTLYDAAHPDHYEDTQRHFFSIFDEESSGLAYQLDYWEYSFDHVDPVARLFWDKLWVPFVDHLATELNDEKANAVAA